MGPNGYCIHIDMKTHIQAYCPYITLVLYLIALTRQHTTLKEIQSNQFRQLARFRCMGGKKTSVMYKVIDAYVGREEPI